MTIERTFRCDGPACNAHMANSAALEPACPGWIVAHVTPAAGDPLMFCTWDCCMKYAAAQEMTEIIPFDRDQDEPEGQ